MTFKVELRNKYKFVDPIENVAKQIYKLIFFVLFIS